MHIHKHDVSLNSGDIVDDFAASGSRRMEILLAICSDEGLTLETSAFQSLYGGQFTLSTPLINQIFVFHSPTNAAPQFLQKLTPFTH